MLEIQETDISTNGKVSDSLNIDGTIDKDKLKSVIKQYNTNYQNRKKINQNLSISLGVGGIVLSLLATVCGIYKQIELAAVLSASAAATQSIIFAYPVDKRASYYRLLLLKNSNLAEELEVTQNNNQEELTRILTDFLSIKIESADEDKESRNLSETLSKIIVEKADDRNVPESENISNQVHKENTKPSES